MGWDVALCGCNGTLAWDPKTIQRALGLDAAPLLYQRLWRDEIHRFMDGLSRGATDRLLVACCGPAALFREAAGAAGVDPSRVEVLNAREPCFLVHGDRRAANAKAARLLRAAMRASETSRPRPVMPVQVGPTVLIVTDSRRGLDLARRLGDAARPALLLDERSAAFDGERLHPLPWKVTWGRLARIGGSVGAFRATIEREQPIDLGACIHCMRCVPVCHTSAISAGLRLRLDRCDRCGDCLRACQDVGAIRIPRADRETVAADQVVVLGTDGAVPTPSRTGLHVLRDPAGADIDALAWKVLGLIGDFQKPQYVAYDATSCAGGAAGREACGRCLPACPYGAIERLDANPLRVRVDQAACEGCGACISACPTSSLTFSDPSGPELHERLRALLEPVAGGPPDPPVIAFHCPEKGAAALEDAARAGISQRAATLPVPVACLRHVSEADILTAFRHGAGAVALAGCEACPHGEREGLFQRLEVVRLVLDAFGLGGERVHLITGEGASIVDALDRVAASVAPSPVAWEAGQRAAATTRDAVADAIRVLLTATGRTPGRVRVPAHAPYGFPDVQVRGCTLCRTCVNVCPTHAFRYDEARHALELRQVACVDCGLCAPACPESVITLRDETFLDAGALAYQTVVQDEPLRCTKCGTPFGTRRAVEVIEQKVLGMSSLLDTFAGPRRNLLRMCANCRAVAAVAAMQEGWEP
jgi:ferredoxin